MSTELSTNTDLEIKTLEDWFEQELVCQINYTDCTVFDVSWVADGQCPQCNDKTYHRLICNSCADDLRSGERMSHRSCGYSGLGIDFFPVLNRL